MRRMLVAVTVGLLLAAGTAAAAKPTPDPNDPKVFLIGKTVDFSESRPMPVAAPDRVAYENVVVNGAHYVIDMRFYNKQNSATFEPISLTPLTTARIAEVVTDRMHVDGDAADWEGIDPVVTDPVNDDGSLYSGVAGTDLAAVYMAHDGTNLYVRWKTHDGGPLTQALYVVVLKQYFLTYHTPGDTFIACFDNGGGWEVMDGNIGQPPSHFYPAPTLHGASGPGFVEIVVPLADVLIPDPIAPRNPAGPVDRGIENRFVEAYIHPGPHPNPPPVSDANAWPNWPLIIDFYH